MAAKSFTFDVATHGKTTALVYRASEPIGAAVVLAHGAGAAQTHPFLVDMATRIAKGGVEEGERCHVPGIAMKIVMLVNALSPRFMRRAFAGLLGRMVRKKQLA